MDERAEDLLREAMSLSVEARAEIAGQLLKSLEPPDDRDVEEAWRVEVRKRIEQLDSGTVKTTPWEEVRDRLYAELSGRRKS